MSETFERAADAIEAYGHNRGSYGTPQTGFCAVGAVGFAVTGSFLCTNTDEEQELLGDALVRLMDATRPIVPTWSDRVPTQEVLDTLRRLGKEARLEEEGLAP